MDEGQMQYAQWVVVTSGVLIGAAAMCAAGCDPYDCRDTLTCPTSASTGGGGDGAGTGGGGADTGGGGASVNCDPTISSDFNMVDASCGVYVWSNAFVVPYLGTNTNPYKTLAAALTDVAGRTNPKLRNVYVCNEGTFTEPVALSEDVTLWGGLNCDNLTWNYADGSKTALTALAGAIPLTVSGTVDVTVHDFAITAAPATALGGSSIAVVVDSATATFTHCDLSAGDAKDGASGVNGGVPAPQAGSGMQGDDAGAKNASGGSGGTNTCDTNDPGVPANLAGGPGGGGGSVIGGGGGNGGQGDIDKGGGGGNGGNNLLCSVGQDGSGRTTPVNGLAGLGIGDINVSGYHGADGTNGTNGTNGTSGGGGGGTKASMTYGAAGGGGGAGGCGGKLGTKGEAGGSSIALMGLKATVTMSACTLSAGKGGNGGAGGDGQPGQQGGNGGIGGMGSAPAVLPGCDGGKGGKGCDGGNGGGGSGGHSLGIAMAGGMLTQNMPLSAFQPTVNGVGGLGGNMNVSGNKGTKGLSIWCWDFDGTQDGKACKPSNKPPS